MILYSCCASFTLVERHNYQVKWPSLSDMLLPDECKHTACTV
jgi:hypothetical protein